MLVNKRKRSNPNKNPNPPKSKMLLKNFAVLSKQEKESLLFPMTRLNMKKANREDMVNYLYSLEQKIHAIRQCTRLGKELYALKLNFDTEFVYNILIDMFVLMDDYVELKDKVLYNKYAKDCEKEDYRKQECIYNCNTCEMDNLFWKDREYISEADANCS